MNEIAQLQLPTVDDRALILEEPADFVPSFFNRALKGHPGAPVIGVQATPIGTGQMAASYRVRLDYDGNPGQRPRSLVAKIASGTPDQRAMISQAYRVEVGFYLQLAERAGARVPHCWYGAINPDHTSFTLLLEDLAPSTPGKQVDGCTLPQAHAAVVNLAAFHASFWNDESIRSGMAWLVELDPEMMSDVFIGSVGEFAERLGDALPAKDAETLRAAAELYFRWITEHATPFSLVHGDYRLDNLMFTPKGPGAAALDWQSLMVGHPGRDLAYFIGASLPAELRKANEETLLTAYHAALRAYGVIDYSLDDTRHGYKIGMIQGPLITVLGFVFAPAERTDEADAMFLSMTARFCQAIRDLGTLDALR